MRRLPVVLGAAALLLLSGGPALAEEPFRLDEQVVDEAGVLGGRGGGRRTRSTSCRPRTAPSSSSSSSTPSTGLDAGEWMQSTGDLSGLGGNDALLAVAVEDRDYAFTLPAGSELSADEANSLAGQAVEPEFAEGDWATGTVAFADILRTGEAPGSGGSDSGRRRGAARRRRDRGSPAAAPTWCRGRAAASGRRSRRRWCGWRSPTRTPG